VHFLDAWVELSPLDAVRLLGPLALLVISTLVPGHRAARLAALAVAGAIPLLRELAAPPALALGWVALWLLLAFLPREPDEAASKPLAQGRGVFEAGAVGLLLALALGLLLLMAVARQDMSPEETRRVSMGAALLVVGILHLMLRRHIRRALVGFATLGLGLQILDGAAQGAQLDPNALTGTGVLLASWLAVILGLRVAAGRERYAGTAWVGDAHDLHD
jgi:hypothetical protein